MGKLAGVLAVIAIFFLMGFVPALTHGYTVEAALGFGVGALFYAFVIGPIFTALWYAVFALNGLYFWSEEKRKRKYGIK